MPTNIARVLKTKKKFYPLEFLKTGDYTECGVGKYKEKTNKCYIKILNLSTIENTREHKRSVVNIFNK